MISFVRELEDDWPHIFSFFLINLSQCIWMSYKARLPLLFMCHLALPTYFAT